MHKARAAPFLIMRDDRGLPRAGAAARGHHLRRLNFKRARPHLLAFDFSARRPAFDFDSLKDSVLDAREFVLDAKLVLTRRRRPSTMWPRPPGAERSTTKANAGAVLKPIKEAKAACCPRFSPCCLYG